MYVISRSIAGVVIWTSIFVIHSPITIGTASAQTNFPTSCIGLKLSKIDGNTVYVDLINNCGECVNFTYRLVSPNGGSLPLYVSNFEEGDIYTANYSRPNAAGQTYFDVSLVSPC